MINHAVVYMQCEGLSLGSLLRAIKKQNHNILHLSVLFCFFIGVQLIRASLMAQLVKNPPPMWETWVQSLGWEDPLEKGKATHSSALAWKIPWTVYTWGRKELGLP